MSITTQTQQQGSSLIEVMVALFILAIGLLGYAGLQTEGISLGRQSYMHSQAAFMAQDIAERMFGNRTVAKAGGYAVSFGDSFNKPPCDDGTTVCTSAQLADFDRAEWLDNVAASLPAGLGAVEVSNAGATTTVTVSIQYQLSQGRLTADQQALGTNPPQTYTYTLVTNL